MADEPTTILESVKDKIGIIEGDDAFDGDLLDYIGASVATLNQLGVENTVLVDKDTKYDELWAEGTSNETKQLAITYIKLNTKLMFDTPASGAENSNKNAALAQIEWRIGISVSSYNESK